MRNRAYLLLMLCLVHLPRSAWAESDTSNAARAHVNRCIAHYVRGDLAGAIADLRMALLLRPRDADLHFMLGNALYRSGEILGAAREYQTTLTQKPQHFEAQMSRGFALFELAQVPTAVSEWLLAVRLEPQQPFSRAALAVGLYSMGDLDGAQMQYAKAIDLDPSYRQMDRLRMDIRWKPGAIGILCKLLKSMPN